MSRSAAENALRSAGFADRVIVMDQNTATVQLAAEALGVEPGRIAKTLSFLHDGGALMIVAEGAARIDNAKFKHFFGIKAHMLPFAEVEPLIGHAPGGVCPFGVNEGVKVYLDISMKRFPTMFPAAGEENNAIELTPEELEK